MPSFAGRPPERIPRHGTSPPRTGPRRPGAAGTVAAPASAAVARGPARQRVRHRRGGRHRSRGHGPSRARLAAPARARARPGEPEPRSRAAGRVHARALGPLRPGGADHGAERCAALDAPESRAHDEGGRGPGAHVRAPLRDRPPVGRARRDARRLPRGARRREIRHSRDRHAGQGARARGGGRHRPRHLAGARDARPRAVAHRPPPTRARPPPVRRPPARPRVALLRPRLHARPGGRVPEQPRRGGPARRAARPRRPRPPGPRGAPAHRGESPHDPRAHAPPTRGARGRAAHRVRPRARHVGRT